MCRKYHARVYSYAILSMSDRISVESVTQEMSQKEIAKKRIKKWL